MNALEVLRKYQDENEYHFHEVDEKWIVEAMEEYGRVFPGFWNRLKMFVEDITVNDAMSEEEKDMILHICTNRIKQL